MAAEPLEIVCAGKQRFYGRDKNLPSSTFDNSSEEFLLASMVNESCLNLTFTPSRFLIVNMVDEGRLLMLQPSNSYFAYRPILQVLKSEVRVYSRHPSRVAPDLRPAACHARHLFEQSGMIFNLYTMPRPTFDKGLATVLVFCLAFATSDREIPRLRIFGGWISCHCIPRKNTVSALPSTIATQAPATLNSMSRAATSPMYMFLAFLPLVCTRNVQPHVAVAAFNITRRARCCRSRIRCFRQPQTTQADKPSSISLRGTF